MPKIVKQISFYALVVVIILFSVFPFYYAILSSMESGSELFVPNYLPAEFSISNYVAVFTEQPFARNIFNSVVVATVVVALSLFWV
jgi:trehalose/maltose transport system permease protein